MKHLLLFSGMTLCLAASAQSQQPAQRPSELRIAIQQSLVASRTAALPPPRQLSPEERAELRRQVQQQSGRSAR